MSKILTIDGISLVVPQKDDPCDLWITYFDRLQQAVGKSHAKTVWLITWQSQGAISCTTRPAFNSWLSRKGLEVSNLATRTIADVSAIQGNLFGLGKSLTKVLAVGVPLLLVAILVGVFVVGKKAVTSADQIDITDLTPLTKATKLLKP